MNEESVSNQYSPIDQLDSSDNFEMMNAIPTDQQPPSINLSESECEDELRKENVQVQEAKNNESDKDKCTSSDQVNQEVSNRRDDVDKTDLNDDISEDEGNFEKDDELDFEEGENSRGDNDNVPHSQQRKKPAEDGEVNSEEELEDGEVKEEDSDEDDQFDGNANNLNLQSPANLNALCRFYSKGLCTWGSSCRFVHQKPIGTSASYTGAPAPSYSPKANVPPTIIKPTMSQPPLILKSSESLNQIKPNNNFQKHNPNYSKVAPLPTANSMNNNNTSSGSGSYYTSNQDQYRYVKKEQHQYTSTKAYTPTRSDDLDYDMQYQPSRNRYTDDRISSTSNYSRNTSSSSNYYTSIKPHHQSSSSQPTHHPSSSVNYRSSNNSYESEYERKRRLAFESAPWNDTNNELRTSPPARESSIDRHSQSSGGKMYKHHPTSSSSNYVKKSESSTHSAEHYRDPWRRSKSPQLPAAFSSSSNRGTPHHQQSASTMYSKSKSDSGSNFSNSESEMMEHSGHGAKSRRLDPAYANKHLPASFREGSNGETMSPYDHQTNLTNKKSYNYKQPPPPEELDNQSYHHHSTSSTAYQKSSTNTPTQEMDIPNYERPKNLPPRTRKDSWSDSDSCSSSSNSSYTGTGASDSDSNSDRDEPYSRTNKFESTREVGNEPQLKRQRTVSSDNNSRLSSKHDQLNKAARSPYSPTAEFSSSSNRYSSTGRKKHSIMNCDDLGSPSYLDDDELGLESSERTSQKKLKSNRFDLERNGSNNDNNDNNDTNDSTGDQKKAELLHQLKAIEEAIARKRSKLK